MARIAALKLGSPVGFDDRWKGKVSALDITDDWEVTNLTVSAGGVFSRQSVKLPISAAKLSSGSVRITGTSTQAFAREIPPLAAPAVTLTSDTPAGQLNFAGVFVGEGSRVVEILVSRGGTTYRVPQTQVTLEGGRLSFTSEPDNLPEYHFDDDVLEAVRAVIRNDKLIMNDEKMHVTTAVNAGELTLNGNVWVAANRKYIESLVSDVPGVHTIRNEIYDDLGVEEAIGLTLAREGVAQIGVYPRVNLGDVTLYGTPASPRQGEDIEHAVARVPGVRKVRTRFAVLV